MSAEILLELDSVRAGYGDLMVLNGLSLQLRDGECCAVLGPNGVGKTTLMRTIAGVLPRAGGTVRLESTQQGDVSQQRWMCDIGWVPEGRLLFGDFSVLDNLMLSARAAGRADGFEQALEESLELFPPLKDKLRDKAGTLSGGQQQMVAIARALVSRPRLLMLDEPSMGLAPLVVDHIRTALERLREQGLAVLVAEQNISWLQGFVDSVSVLRHGVVELSGTGDLLEDRDALRSLYLGA
jgi:branched-chain amino acid transport system ATP-binding protein